MAHTKRAQILMDPDEYERLAQIAAAQGCSVAALIREAVRERYLTAVDDRFALVEEIAAMDVPVADWSELKALIEEAHHGGVH